MKSLMNKVLGVVGLGAFLSFSPLEAEGQDPNSLTVCDSFYVQDSHKDFVYDSVDVNHDVKDSDNDSFPEKVKSTVSYNGEDYLILKKKDKNGDNVHDYFELESFPNRFLDSKEGIKNIDSEKAHEVSVKNGFYKSKNELETYEFSESLDTVNSYNWFGTSLGGADVSASENNVPYRDIENVESEKVKRILVGSGESFGTYSVGDYNNGSVWCIENFLRREFYQNAFANRK